MTELDAKTLGRWFQVRSDNPLLGLEGRTALLRRLGDTENARAAYDRAIELAGNTAETALLTRRRDKLR